MDATLKHKSHLPAVESVAAMQKSIQFSIHIKAISEHIKHVFQFDHIKEFPLKYKECTSLTTSTKDCFLVIFAFNRTYYLQNMGVKETKS